MLGVKVRELRLSMKLTQEEFAKKLGISRSYLGDIERGRLKGNNVKIISILSDISGKPMEYFLDKKANVKLYDTLDAALDMIIDKGLVDEEGNILDETSREIIYNILKTEIKLKIKTRES